MNQEKRHEILELAKIKYGIAIENNADLWFLTEVRDQHGTLKDIKVSVDKVTDHLLDKTPYKTIYTTKSEQVWMYGDGIWHPNARGYLKQQVEHLLGNFAKNNTVNEIVEKLKRKTLTEQTEFDKVPDYKMCLQNGVLDLSCDEPKVINFSPEFNFKTKLPLKYDPRATCPKIHEFLVDTFAPDDLVQFQEWLGFHLVRPYHEKKAVIIFGLKNTSKSTLLNLIHRFLGQKNIAGLSLQKVTEGKAFDRLVLKDKLANIADDLKSQDLRSTGDFKAAVGDGMITGEQKFGDVMSFRNTAKHTFACNQIPHPGEVDDEAFFDRWLLWRLDNVIPKEQQDKSLINKLTTEGELSGLLNWAIEGYQRLVKNNGFSNEKSVEETKSIMMSSADPLYSFVQGKVNVDPGAKISKADFYNEFVTWCSQSEPKQTPCNKSAVTNRLKHLIPEVVDAKSGSERVWRNITIASQKSQDESDRRDERPTCPNNEEEANPSEGKNQKEEKLKSNMGRMGHFKNKYERLSEKKEPKNNNLKYIHVSDSNASQTSHSDLDKPLSQMTTTELITTYLKKFDRVKGISFEILRDALGFSDEQLDAALDRLKESGDILEPRSGHYKLLR